jgi:hypothetical protein
VLLIHDFFVCRYIDTTVENGIRRVNPHSLAGYLIYGQKVKDSFCMPARRDDLNRGIASCLPLKATDSLNLDSARSSGYSDEMPLWRRVYRS